MKKWVVSLAMCMSIVFLGCSKKEGPEEAVKSFYESFSTGNYEEFKKSVTPETYQLFNAAIMLTCKRNQTPDECYKDFTKKEKKDFSKIEIIKTEKIDDKHANVLIKEYKKNGTYKTTTVPVVKTEEGWKVYIKK
jgi:hypothetical protein